MKRGKSLRQAGDSRPGCWMVNTDCRYEVRESMAALVSASLASLRLAVTERSTAAERGTYLQLSGATMCRSLTFLNLAGHSGRQQNLKLGFIE